jgi:hypothetical protein
MKLSSVLLLAIASLASSANAKTTYTLISSTLTTTTGNITPIWSETNNSGHSMSMQPSGSTISTTKVIGAAEVDGNWSAKFTPITMPVYTRTHTWHGADLLPITVPDGATCYCELRYDEESGSESWSVTNATSPAMDGTYGRTRQWDTNILLVAYYL